ncbi:hypothetical protein AeMF1_006634 [Aphanomyces euteiches]|nr:hypothetical protein AeMF1_006634 [Aphanomyces euteiches]
MLNKLPKLLCDAVLSNFDVNGAVPLTREYLDTCLENLRESMSTKGQACIVPEQPAISTGATVATFTWVGRLHPCMWFEGIPASNIGTLRKLRSLDLQKRGDAAKLSKARKVIAIVASAAGYPNLLDVASMDAVPRKLAYERGFLHKTKSKMQLMSPDEWAARRVNEMSYITFYDIVLKHKYE